MTTDTGSFDLHRTIPLPPTRLWEVLTDAKHREVWGGPDADTVMVVDQADVRVGGQDRHRCGPKETPYFTVDTRWYDLSAPDRAVFTETLHVEGATMCTSLVTYAVTGTDAGSTLDVTVAVSSFTGPEAVEEFKQGWGGGLDNLERYAATLT